MMPGEELFSFNKIEWNLTGNQVVWSIKERYVPEIRDTSLVEVHGSNALTREDDLLQQAEARRLSVRCVLKDQPGIIGYDVVPKQVA